ncbi:MULTISPECIES: SDR family oxidoreductase [Mycolicibacterium]|uniref:SDR family oxidoreductase n=1 Tax=Mycolicibacterium TaxID=1866885 RepID=UPI00092ADCD6|nr:MULTISPECIES: SDR family oxidoreductase [Mycolicibacterium]UCZ58286.1 SDR family oxidoreductase [Mycolicibacterium phocaicum]SHW40881.1 oxidoreductase [Mycobacteroides abscessus subsp. abscessus]
MTDVNQPTPSLRVLVTGATGYIGGRLVPRVIEAGHHVRVLARNPDKISDVPWAADVEVVRGDLTDADTLGDACRDIDVIYYLVHSMGNHGEFTEAERRSAENLASAARGADVKRIVYLSGLHTSSDRLSPHLRSRSQVGEILIKSGVPTFVLQAGVVIGSGSASFEMIRHLTNRLPVMTTPRWVNNRIQPIAIRDVLYYLLAAATADLPRSRTYDIGGPDVLRYGEMMQIYADVAGLAKRRILVLPVLTPKLAGLWIGLVTPVPPQIGRALIESLSTDAIVAEHDIDAVIPPPPGGTTGYREAVRLALRRIKNGEVETTWANASPTGAPADPLPSDPSWTGDAIYTDDRSLDSDAAIEQVWRVVEGIGGERGWYSFPLAWTIRGWLDVLTGGVGLARGRRNPNTLYTGDALDFWRVERIERPHLLRLRAEMRAPGKAWLQWELQARGDTTHLHQRAIFFPKGLAGRLYWYALMPFHGIIFTGMIKNIAAEAQKERTRAA